MDLQVRTLADNQLQDVLGLFTSNSRCKRLLCIVAGDEELVDVTEGGKDEHRSKWKGRGVLSMNDFPSRRGQYNAVSTFSLRCHLVLIKVHEKLRGK